MVPSADRSLATNEHVERNQKNHRVNTDFHVLNDSGDNYSAVHALRASREGKFQVQIARYRSTTTQDYGYDQLLRVAPAQQRHSRLHTAHGNGLANRTENQRSRGDVATRQGGPLYIRSLRGLHAGRRDTFRIRQSDEDHDLYDRQRNLYDASNDVSSVQQDH